MINFCFVLQGLQNEKGIIVNIRKVETMAQFNHNASNASRNALKVGVFVFARRYVVLVHTTVRHQVK